MTEKVTKFSDSVLFYSSNEGPSDGIPANYTPSSRPLRGERNNEEFFPRWVGHQSNHRGEGLKPRGVALASSYPM